MSKQQRRVAVLPAAEDDIGRLAEDDPRLALRARAVLQLLETGEVEGKPLEKMPKFGDLSDCRKVYFSADGSGRPTHRVVYKVVGTTTSGEEVVEVVEVVAVEARSDAYVYMLASHRVGRLPKETVRESRRVHEQVKARRGDTRQAKRGKT